MSASGCEFQGVRDEVCENLLQLVAIRPRHECVLHAEAVDGDGSLLGVVDEVVAHAVDYLHHVELFDAQPQCVVLELVEVHQLVHELEHPLDIAVGDGEQALVVAAEAFALHDLAHRPSDHRQRRTELVGDVGEETHVHLVRALLLFFLHLCLTCSPTCSHHATGIAVEVVGEGSGEGEIDAPCPPGVGGSRVYGHAQGTLASDGFVAGGVGGFHAEGVASCGQVGIAGSMGVASIDPVAVETVHLIIIMYAFVLAEVEGGEREAEAVLVVSKAYLLATVEQGVDRAVGHRAHQPVVDLQVAEPDGQLSQRVDVGRVEHRDTVSTAEDETAVGQLARGTVSELVAPDAVGLIERGDAPRLSVPAVQALHRADPDIPLAVFLDAAHVRAGEAGDARHLVGFRVVAQQSVAHGAYPHVALRVLQHVGGDVDASADALCHRGDVEFAELARLRIHLRDLLEEGGDEHLSVSQFQQRGYEAEVGIKRLLHNRLRLLLSFSPYSFSPKSHDIIRARRDPHGAVVSLFEVHGAKHGCLAEYGEPPSLVAAFHHDAGRGEPEPSVTVAEDVRHGVLLFARRQSFEGDEFCLPAVEMVDVEPLEQGADPEVLLSVCGDGEHAGVVDHAVQVAVRAAELLLIVVVGEETFVVGAEPHVFP